MAFFEQVDFSRFESARDILHEQCYACETEIFYTKSTRKDFEDDECQCDPPRVTCSDHTVDERTGGCVTCQPFEVEDSSEEESSSSSEELRRKYKKLKKRMVTLKKRFRDDIFQPGNGADCQ